MILSLNWLSAHRLFANSKCKEKFKHLIKKPLDAIKSLVVSFNPNDTTFSLSVQDRELYVSNNLTQSLTDVFTTIGETALKTETPICFY